MAFDTKTFTTRTVSAVIFGITMLLAFLSNEIIFITLFFIINILLLKEYVAIIEKILETQFSKIEKINYFFIGATLFLFICSLQLNLCENKINLFLEKNIFFFLGLTIGSIISLLYFKKNKKIYYIISAFGYISFSLALLVQLRFQSLLLPLILLLFLWINDTLAYLCGSFFGKTKYVPTISPNKTLEGTLGGIFFTILIAIIWGLYTDWFPIWQWVFYALIVSVMGTIGDLIESKLKRLANIKDSGNIMPGHGGALDRFDSLLIATPVVFLFAQIFIKCFEFKIF